MHNMSDKLATLDSSIMRRRLQDLKKILQQCLPQDIFSFNADRARRDSTGCFIHVIVMLLL